MAALLLTASMLTGCSSWDGEITRVGVVQDVIDVASTANVDAKMGSDVDPILGTYDVKQVGHLEEQELQPFDFSGLIGYGWEERASNVDQNMDPNAITYSVIITGPMLQAELDSDTKPAGKVYFEGGVEHKDSSNTFSGYKYYSGSGKNSLIYKYEYKSGERLKLMNMARYISERLETATSNGIIFDVKIKGIPSDGTPGMEITKATLDRVASSDSADAIIYLSATKVIMSGDPKTSYVLVNEPFVSWSINAGETKATPNTDDDVLKDFIKKIDVNTYFGLVPDVATYYYCVNSFDSTNVGKTVDAIVAAAKVKANANGVSAPQVALGTGSAPKQKKNSGSGSKTSSTTAIKTDFSTWWGSLNTGIQQGIVLSHNGNAYEYYLHCHDDIKWPEYALQTTTSGNSIADRYNKVQSAYNMWIGASYHSGSTNDVEQQKTKFINELSAFVDKKVKDKTIQQWLQVIPTSTYLGLDSKYHIDWPKGSARDGSMKPLTVGELDDTQLKDLGKKICDMMYEVVNYSVSTTNYSTTL